MPVKYYNASDAGAPVLDGQIGSMIALLDAVLVNGYGSKTGAGWTKVYTSGNVVVYRNNPLAPGSTGMYLRVDDTDGYYCTVKAYKTMSDVNIGTDPIPSGTPSYSNTEIFWAKSQSSDSTPRPWGIVADDRTFYFNAAPGGSLPSYVSTYAFIYGAGDFETYVPGNTWNYFLAGSYAPGYSQASAQITNDQSSYGCAVIGRSQELLQDKNSKIWIAPFGMCSNTGSTSHFAYSAYTGLRFFYPALLIENATQMNITGKLRGTYGYAGRTTGNWLENFGKLPDDPSGPDMIQFMSGNSDQAMYVRLGNW